MVSNDETESVPTKILFAMLAKLNLYPSLYNIEIINKTMNICKNWYHARAGHMTKIDPRWMCPCPSGEKDGIKIVKINMKDVQ